MRPDLRLMDARLILAREGVFAALDVPLSDYSIDSVNFRLGLLLFSGRLDEADELVRRAEQSDTTDAETRSFTAILRLLQRDFNAASSLAEEALDQRPEWERVRVNAAIVDYHAVFPPSQLPDVLPVRPSAAPTEVLLSTPEAVVRTRRAAARLADVLAETQPSAGRRTMLELWRLGALCNDLAQLDAATAYAASLVDRPQPNYFALHWIIERGLKVDYAPLINNLRAEVERSNDPDLTVILCEVYIEAGSGKEAAELIEPLKETFSRDGDPTYWLLLMTRALIVRKTPEDARALLAAHPEASGAARITAIFLDDIAVSDPAELRINFERQYVDTNNPVFLMNALHVAMRQRDFQYVADRADELLRQLPSAESYEIALTAMYNSGDYAKALQVLEIAIGDARLSPFPSSLLQLHALLLQRFGRISEAINAANAFVQARNSTEGIALLANLYFADANITQAASTANLLRSRDDASVEQLLGAAYSLGSYQASIASDLWDAALKKPTPDALVVPALTLGYRLGKQGAEMTRLLHRVQELGHVGTDSVKAYSQEDAIEMIRQRAQSVGDYNRMYAEGRIPIHFLSDYVHIPLVVTHHEMLERNAALPLRQHTVIYIRHGSRVHTDPAQDARNWRLNLDVTAVILAQHLGILDAIVSIFPEVRIPWTTIPLLTEMMNELADQQPERSDLRRRVLALIQAGRLAVTTVPDVRDEPLNLADLPTVPLSIRHLYAYARAQGTYVLDFLPLRSYRDGLVVSEFPAQFPDGIPVNALNPPKLLLILRPYLTQFQYERAVASLGPGENPAPLGADVPIGATITIAGLVAETLEEAGILEMALQRFSVSVLKEYETRLHELTVESDRRQRLHDWIAVLRKDIGGYRNAGSFATMPDANVENPGDRGLSYRTLLELVAFETEPHDVVWSDDRFVNANPHRDGGNFVIGISEVLQLLRHRSAITDDRYYDLLLMLRKGSAYFLPVDADELLYHLRNALVDGIVQPRAELATLRRYVAGAIGVRAIVQQLGQDPDRGTLQLGEVSFFAALAGSIRTAVRSAFEEMRVSEASSCADWLLTNLYFEDMKVYADLTSIEPVDAQLAADVGYARLIAEAVDLGARYED